MFQIDSHWYSFTREESRKEAVSRELLRGDQKNWVKEHESDKNLMITTMSLKTMSNMTAGLRCPNWDWESATRRPWLILRKKIPSLLLSSQQASWSSMMVKHNKKRMKICGSQFVNINVSPSSQWGELPLTFGNHQCIELNIFLLRAFRWCTRYLFIKLPSSWNSSSINP